MKTYNQFLTTPFSEDKKWIQKATKNMRKDKPCTGEKFGSETCPPGSKRYNLAKTFKKMAKEEATPEPPKEDPAMKSKEKRQMQLKKQVLLKKMQAVRAGAGADIVASHTPEGEMVEGVGRAAIGAAIGSVAGPVGAAAGAAIGASLGKKKVTSGAGGKKKPKNFFKAEPKVTTSEDKAFDYVVAKLRKQHGDDAVLTKGQKPKPLTAAQKKKNAEIRAKRAKEDHRDPTEKASSGRYSDRYSNRGSD